MTERLRATLLAGSMLAACTEPARVQPVPQSLPAAAPTDRGDTCADVADVRACWGRGVSGDGCAAGVCLVERPEPWPSPGGWRCQGAGDDRTCEPRARTRAPFSCEGETCAQARPRMPDDGEWECADLAGVVVCRGGAPAAGVVPGRADRGWTCGPRRGVGNEERICADAAPDLPDPSEGGAGPWRCKIDRRYPIHRVCTRVARHDGSGAKCANAGDCARGLACAGGRCLPAAFDPACWLDEDCGDALRCRIGSCVEVPR